MLRASLYPREEARSKRNTSTRGTVIWGPGCCTPGLLTRPAYPFSPALLVTGTPAVHRTVGVVGNLLLPDNSSQAVFVLGE